MLTIGTFAHLGHISVRMLRHYDAIGLLKPAQIDPHSGYRYYESGQLETLSQIQLLKLYRFSLSEIAGLLAAGRPAFIAQLEGKRVELYQEIESLRRLVRLMDTTIEQEETTMQNTNPASNPYKVTVITTQPQRIFGLRREINIGQVHSLFQEAKAEMALRGLKRAGASIMIYHGGEDFSYDAMDSEAAYPVNEEHPDTRILPGGEHVATMHFGPHDQVHAAYEAIGRWLSAHPEYEVTGNGFERYIRDETDGLTPAEYETGVLFPVRRV